MNSIAMHYSRTHAYPGTHTLCISYNISLCLTCARFASPYISLNSITNDGTCKLVWYSVVYLHVAYGTLTPINRLHCCVSL